MGGDLRGAEIAACKIAGLRLPRFESWSCHTPPDLRKRGMWGARVRPLGGAGLPPFSLPGRGADARRAGTRDRAANRSPAGAGWTGAACREGRDGAGPTAPRDRVRSRTGIYGCGGTASSWCGEFGESTGADRLAEGHPEFVGEVGSGVAVPCEAQSRRRRISASSTRMIVTRYADVSGCATRMSARYCRRWRGGAPFPRCTG